MTSSTFKEVLATSASFCTILQFLAGIVICRKFVLKGTTGDASCLGFITCFMSCSMWLLYGILILDWSIILVNIFGSVLQFCYAMTYTVYTIRKAATSRQIVLATVFVAMMYTYVLFYESDKALITPQIGFLSCSLTILFFASPLTLLAHVIKVKNTESLPFPVIMASFVVSCQWFAYGCILEDRFIQTPNFLGCVLSAFQLFLFFLYPHKRMDQELLI